MCVSSPAMPKQANDVRCSMCQCDLLIEHARLRASLTE
jgi:hypothetical protein